MLNKSTSQDLHDTLRINESVLRELKKQVEVGEIAPQLTHIFSRYAHHITTLAERNEPTLTHALQVVEQAWSSARLKGTPAPKELIASSLEIYLATIAILESRNPSGDFTSALASLVTTSEKQRGPDLPSMRKLSLPLTATEKSRLDNAKHAKRHTYTISKNVSSMLTDRDLKRLPVFDELKELGAEVIASWPTPEQFDAGFDCAPIQILFSSNLDCRTLSDKLFDLVQPVEFEAREIVSEKCSASIPEAPSSPRILVVEDDLGSRKVLLSQLAKFGECEVAVNGQEGIVSFLLGIEEGRPFDMVFLDVMMPEVTGRDMLRYARQVEESRRLHITHPAKIVMTTALDDKESILGAFREGCEGYLVKPIDKRKLRVLLGKLNPELSDLDSTL